ncbi:MAG: SAM-dependent methyltransferase [Proteobacteria bacterium]|nr:SAM-dependent methyltransferase [Pseudomonadota bacterium]
MAGNRNDMGARAPKARTLPVLDTSKAEREIVRRINADGPMTFAEFMDLALYAEPGGYYTSTEGRWGTGADYVTSIDISPAFARVFARQIEEMWRVMGSPCAFSIIEAGAGRGWFGRGILDTIEELFPELYDATTLTLVDRGIEGAAPESEVGEERHKVDKIVRLTELPEASASAPFGVIISNELIDSFPVHRLLVESVPKDGDTGKRVLKEYYVDLVDGALAEVLKEPSTPELSEYLAPFELVEGQRVDVNLGAAKWLARAALSIGTGFVISIDYGLPGADLYAPGRVSTLVCHWRHTINDSPYLNVGHQDITTHVDFSNMAVAGRGVGLELTGFTTQKNFLIGAGILDELQTVTGEETSEVEIVRHNRSIQELIMPGGMGDTFKVLVQHKGLDAPALKGFEFKEMSKYL